MRHRARALASYMHRWSVLGGLLRSECLMSNAAVAESGLRGFAVLHLAVYPWQACTHFHGTNIQLVGCVHDWLILQHMVHGIHKHLIVWYKHRQGTSAAAVVCHIIPGKAVVTYCWLICVGEQACAFWVCMLACLWWGICTLF